MKLLVEIDLNKALLRGSKIKLDDEMIWVDFKYEQLPRFYFYCGKLGHQEKLCETKVKDSTEGCLYEDQYGDWLRAPISKGIRRGDTTEHGNATRSNSPKSRHGGEKSQSDARGIVTILQEGSLMKDSVKGNSDELRRLNWKDCEKEADRGERQSEDAREKQKHGEWRSEQGKQNEVENKGGRRRQDCTHHEARRRHGSGWGGSDFRTREGYTIGCGSKYYDGRGGSGRIEIKKGNQGTWKRISKEKQQGVAILADICKENLQCLGRKRVKEHNEGEGEQSWEEGTVQHSKCQKV